MTDLETLNKLISATRRAKAERDLVCPLCGYEVVLRDGVYFCNREVDSVSSSKCYGRFATLADLAIRGER